MKVIVILIYRGQLKFRKSRRQLTTGNIAHGKAQKRQNCVSIIFRQQICNEKYDSVDIATPIVKRSFSEHLCLVEVIFEKLTVYFPKKPLQKDATGHSQKPHPRFVGDIITCGQRIS